VNEPSEFFVGYLRLPPGLRRFSGKLAAATLTLCLGGALALALSMPRAPGAPATDHGRHLQGLYTAEPYGVVWTSGEGGPHATLLTQGGKHGVVSPGDPLDGRVIDVAGQRLARGGVSLLELGEGIHPAAGNSATPLRDALRTSRRDLGEVTVRGQIEDAKCYAGRMRPGTSMPHRACAQLCVRGGIPPVLVARDAAGVEVAYVLATRDGHAINAAIVPYLVEPVEVRGRLERIGDLLLLKTDLASVRRL